MISSNFINRVAETIARENLLTTRARLIVCVSGGADSVALLLALHDLGYDCIVAHCNFSLRGDESDGDEMFVENLSRQLGLHFETTRFDVDSYKNSHKGVSTEMACRELRYKWFESIAKSHSADYIAVGHNKNDREETFFLNLFRGTGLNGLASIRYKNGNVVRPLLDRTKAEIIDFLDSKQVAFRTDSSNLSNDYERNKVRNLLLPQMLSIFPNAAISRTICNLNSSAEFYNFAINHFAEQLTISSNTNETIIDIDCLKQIPGHKALLFHILNNYGFNSDQTHEVLKAETGANFYSSTHRVNISRGNIIITDTIGNNHDNAEYEFNLANLNTEKLPIDLELGIEEYYRGYPFVKDNTTIYLNTDILAKRATLRRWRKGDYMYPFGMSGRRKLLSDIFSDAKLSQIEKDKIWILEVENEIIWIPGLRASYLYPVKAGSKMAVIKLNRTI